MSTLLIVAAFAVWMVGGYRTFVSRTHIESGEDVLRTSLAKATACAVVLVLLAAFL